MNLSLQQSSIIRHELPKTLGLSLDAAGVPKESALRRVGDFFAKSGAVLPGAQKAEDKIKSLLESSAHLDSNSRALLLVAAAMTASKHPIPSQLLPAVASMSGLDNEATEKLSALMHGQDSELAEVFDGAEDIYVDVS